MTEAIAQPRDGRAARIVRIETMTAGYQELLSRLSEMFTTRPEHVDWADSPTVHCHARNYRSPRTRAIPKCIELAIEASRTASLTVLPRVAQVGDTIDFAGRWRHFLWPAFHKIGALIGAGAGVAAAHGP